MKLRTTFLLTFCLFSSSLVAGSDSGQDGEILFKVVASDDIPQSEIDRYGLERIFLAQIETWSNGVAVRVVNLPPDSEVRAQFSEAVLGRSTATIRNFYQRKRFSGQLTVMPDMVPSDEQVLKRLQKHSGAIGYVSASARLIDGVRVVGGDSPSTSDVSVLADTVLSERGAIRLLLTGRCGPEMDGRRAIVQNRHPQESHRLRLAQSYWLNDKFRSSSTEAVRLAPLEEHSLGCTRPGNGTEIRYSIDEVFNASALQPDPLILNERPARDLARLVEGGPCGKTGEGRRLMLVNKHSARSISSQVTFYSMVQGKTRQVYSKSYRLSPGAEKTLGCSADGQTQLRIELVSASY